MESKICNQFVSNLGNFRIVHQSFSGAQKPTNCTQKTSEHPPLEDWVRLIRDRSQTLRMPGVTRHASHQKSGRSHAPQRAGAMALKGAEEENPEPVGRFPPPIPFFSDMWGTPPQVEKHFVWYALASTKNHQAKFHQPRGGSWAALECLCRRALSSGGASGGGGVSSGSQCLPTKLICPEKCPFLVGV